ncbi:MAG: hypothetical protein WEE64_06865 [Dehalococcoidia bacterium]
MRARVRRDLHDEEPASQRWRDPELDRHIARAVQEASVASPQEVKSTLTTTAGSRDLDISSLSGRVSIEAVEHPTGQFPPSYVRFSVWGDTLTLLLDSPPAGAEQVAVYYGALHSLDATGSTLPAALEDVVATGAAAYAALAWASFATNRVNAGGDETWRNYLVFGQERLAAFAQALAEQGRKGVVRARQLYTPAGPAPIQSSGGLA